jgi:hypothetical protein
MLTVVMYTSQWHCLPVYANRGDVYIPMTLFPTLCQPWWYIHPNDIVYQSILTVVIYTSQWHCFPVNTNRGDIYIPMLIGLPCLICYTLDINGMYNPDPSLFLCHIFPNDGNQACTKPVEWAVMICLYIYDFFDRILETFWRWVLFV